jgi:hypothetical protein
MATFSIVGHEDASDEGSDSDLLTESLADPTTPDRLPRSSSDGIGGDHDALPLTLLELPDLVAVSQWSDQRWTNWGNRIFWVGIILGSMVALWLIWQPVQQKIDLHEEGPTWDGHAAAPAAAEAAATVGQAAPAWPAEPAATADAHTHEHKHVHDEPAAAPAWPAREPPASPTMDNTDALQPANESEAPPAPGRESAPSFDDWSRQQPAAAPLYTARGGDSRMDGGGVHVAPGEAMPTGKIKNVVTQ